MAGRVRRLIGAAAWTLTLATCAPSPATLDRQYAQAEDDLRRGRVDAAMAAASEGAVRAERIGDDVRTWRFRLLAADAHLARLEMPAALAVLEVSIPDGDAYTAVRARQAQLLARARVAQGQLREAEQLVERALPLAEGDAGLRLDLELLKGQILYRTGRGAAADSLLRASRERVSGEGDSYRLAQVSNNIGVGLLARGRYDEALPYFDSVIADPAMAGTSVQGLAFNNAGICHARLGQFERAIRNQQQAIRIHERGRKQNHAQALGELGTTYLLQDDFARGVEHLQQAFAIANEAGLATDAALFARNLALAFVAMRRWDEAARFNDEASRLGSLNAAAASPYTVITRAQVAAGRGGLAEAQRLFGDALATADAPPGVRWMALEGLGRVAAASGRPDDAARQFEAAVRTVEQTRSSLLRADYRISITSRLQQFYRTYVEFLLGQGQVERALEVADSSRARVLAERQNIAAPTQRASAASLKGLARTTASTLVFYALGRERSWMWVVGADRLAVTELPPAAQIEGLVAEHQSAIQDALADPLAVEGSAGERLYALLVAPIAAQVARRPSVIVVPDGALHRLNFETLIVPGDAAGGTRVGDVTARRRYWIEDVTVQIAPSLGMLQTAAETTPAADRTASATRPAKASGRPSLLLIGNPKARPPEFPALSYAAAEMASLTKHFASDAVTVFDGERASPDAFRGAAPERFSVIHFTSHAVANPETPLDSAVILSGPDDAFKLYARDVAEAKLQADLVTVSACRSAGERAVAGEGLVGFAWAFLRAGSRRVIAGLWDVDDRSTAALMDQVYARLARGASPAAALREAKRVLIRDGYAKPYYWAPFQVFTMVP